MFLTIWFIMFKYLVNEVHSVVNELLLFKHLFDITVTIKLCISMQICTLKE